MNEGKKGFRAKKHRVAHIEPSKPRNFVAKNAKMGGAGAHKDKKKADKFGDAKHKKNYVEHLEDMLQNKLTENRQINETGLDPVRRMKAIQFIVSKTGWERNYVELASDEELMDLYVKVKKGELPETVEEGDDNLDQYDLDQLQSYYSDFHKDLIGFRPRGASEEEWNDPEWLKAEINKLHDYMDRLKSTPQGRAQLKADGWSIDEGSKVDRQAMHITKSMMKRHGMSRDEAEAAAWAHIKHPKKKKKKAHEGWTHDTLAAQLFEQELTYEDKLNSMLAKEVKKK